MLPLAGDDQRMFHLIVLAIMYEPHQRRQGLLLIHAMQIKPRANMDAPALQAPLAAPVKTILRLKR